MYVLQKDEDGCTVTVQSFATVWNMIKTKLMNGERSPSRGIMVSIISFISTQGATLKLLQCLRVICGCRVVQTNSAETPLALLRM